MSPMLEQDVYALWGARNTGGAKGSPIAEASMTRRFIQIGGDFNVAKDQGSQPYSDLSKYGSQVDWVNSVLGQGEPVIETTPTELAWLLWMFHGAETVTAIPGPPAQSKHQFKPSIGRGWYGTFYRRVGQTVVQRHRYNDCIITRLQIEGSTGQKDVRVTPRILSLDPAEKRDTDPTLVMPTDRPFLYTDGVGSFTIDGTVFAGQSQFTLVVDDDIGTTFGDDVVPFELLTGNAVVTIGATVKVDSNALARWNTLVYGSAAPAAGTKPSKNVSALGSYLFSLKQRDAAGALNGRQFDLNIPGVRWAIPDAPGPNPEGGDAEIALAGAMRPTGVFNPGTGLWTVADPYTIDVYTASTDVAFTG
jgi:hypothetical protein